MEGDRQQAASPYVPAEGTRSYLARADATSFAGCRHHAGHLKAACARARVFPITRRCRLYFAVAVVLQKRKAGSSLAAQIDDSPSRNSSAQYARSALKWATMKSARISAAAAASTALDDRVGDRARAAPHIRPYFIEYLALRAPSRGIEPEVGGVRRAMARCRRHSPIGVCRAPRKRQFRRFLGAFLDAKRKEKADESR